MRLNWTNNRKSKQTKTAIIRKYSRRVWMWRIASFVKAWSVLHCCAALSGWLTALISCCLYCKSKWSKYLNMKYCKVGNGHFEQWLFTENYSTEFSSGRLFDLWMSTCVKKHLLCFQKYYFHINKTIIILHFMFYWLCLPGPKVKHTDYSCCFCTDVNTTTLCFPQNRGGNNSQKLTASFFLSLSVQEPLLPMFYFPSPLTVWFRAVHWQSTDSTDRKSIQSHPSRRSLGSYLDISAARGGGRTQVSL